MTTSRIRSQSTTQIVSEIICYFCLKYRVQWLGLQNTYNTGEGGGAVSMILNFHYILIYLILVSCLVSLRKKNQNNLRVKLMKCKSDYKICKAEHPCSKNRMKSTKTKKKKFFKKTK